MAGHERNETIARLMQEKRVIKEDLERLRQFAEMVAKLNHEEGLAPTPLWHVITLAQKALNSQENK